MRIRIQEKVEFLRNRKVICLDLQLWIHIPAFYQLVLDRDVDADPLSNTGSRG